jgi:hypothetical protein
MTFVTKIFLDLCQEQLCGEVKWIIRTPATLSDKELHKQTKKNLQSYLFFFARDHIATCLSFYFYFTNYTFEMCNSVRPTLGIINRPITQ